MDDRVKARRAWTYLLIACGLVVAGAISGSSTFDNAVRLVIEASAAAAVFAGTVANRPASRRPWVSLALCLLLIAVFDAAATFYQLIRHVPVPFPSFLGTVALSYFALAALSFRGFGRARWPGRDPASTIDAWILVAGVSVITWIFVMDPILVSRSVPLLTKLVSAEYLAMTILLIGAAMKALLGSGTRDRAARAVVAAVGLAFATLVVVTIASNRGATNVASALDGGFGIALATVGAIALHPGMRSLTEPVVRGRPRATFRVAMLGAATLIVPAAYAVQTLRGAHIDLLPLAAVTSAICVLMVIRLHKLLGEIEARARDAEARERYLSTIIAASSDGVAVADAAGIAQFVSPAIESVLGLTPERLIGSSVFSLVHHDDLDAALAAFTAVGAEAGVVSSFQTRAEHADGSCKHLDVKVKNLLDEPAVRGIVITVHDATERVLAEESQRQALAAEVANSAKSEFLSRMSHELRTPLNAVLGFAQLLESEDLDERQHRKVDQILKGGRHLLGLMDEVLDIARIDADHLDLSLEPVCVSEVVEECLDMVRPLAKQTRVGLLTDLCSSAADVFVHADRQRLKQVMLNLLSNAVKYNRVRGSVSVGWRVEGREVVVAVTDTGAGIASSDLPKLFAPFERLGADRGEVEGTGLGLAVSRRLAEAMGGGIGVASIAGQGSTFTVRLRGADQPRGKTSQPRAEALAVADVGERSVLYVEDNRSNVQLVEEVLSSWPGVHVVTAMQGRVGLDRAHENPPDLVLLDLNLPDVSGEEVLRLFKADPELTDVPVIVITADAMARRGDELIAMGARAFLTKPIDVSKFVTEVRGALYGKEAA